MDYIKFEYRYRSLLIEAFQQKNFWIAVNQQQLPLPREEFFVNPNFSINSLSKKHLLLNDLRKISPHLTLLGSPGMGKTETLLNLLLAYARQVSTDQIKVERQLLPVLLSAPDLAQQLDASAELTLIELLHEKLQPPHKPYVSEKLAEGHFLLLLDDLNEVAVEQAKQVIAWSEIQIKQFPKNHFIIAARPKFTNLFSQTGAFTIAHFENLSDNSIKALTKKWNRFVPDALNTLASIIQEEQVYPLTSSPLHLLMLLVVGLTTRLLPTHKAQLYAHYINALLAFGDHEKTPPLALMSKKEKLAVLQQIAFTLHKSRRVEMEEAALKTLVQGSLTALNDSFDRGTTQNFIEFMVRSGLLVRRNDNYRLAHFSFQEFLTAQGQGLAETNLGQLLAEQEDDPWWHEVSNFYQSLIDTSLVIDQAFMRETKDLPNIDTNQAYTLSLLIDNIESFDTQEVSTTAANDTSAVFDFDLVNLELEASIEEEEADMTTVRVMVVDDTPQNIQLARFILQREKYIVIEANNAQEAMTLIEEKKPSLILSDIQMPGMDGYEFCRRLKADPETQHIPFIFVTAFSRSTKEAARGLQIGADDYITRPFAPEELLARIGANVRIHQAEEAARRQATILARRNRELALLNQIQRAVTASLNLDNVLDATMKQVQKVLKAETTSLWFVDRASQALLLSAAFNESARTIHGIRLDLQDSMPGYVVRSGHPFLTDNVQEHPEYHSTVKRGEQEIHSMICVPLQVRQQVIGVLQAVHSDLNHFNREDLHLLNAVGDVVTVAIENAWLFGQIQLFNQQLEQKVEARTHELAREKEKTETILISIADSLLVTDPNHKIIMANRAAEELLDFQLQEAMGASIHQDRFDTPLWQFVRDITAQPDPTFTAQTEVTDQDNSEGILAVQAHAAKMWDTTEETYTGNVIVLRDVTAFARS